jgi:hypothetical protein
MHGIISWYSNLKNTIKTKTPLRNQEWREDERKTANRGQLSMQERPTEQAFSDVGTDACS